MTSVSAYNTFVTFSLVPLTNDVSQEGGTVGSAKVDKG